MTREIDIENEFVVKAHTYGVLAKKFVDLGDTGAPDRICLCPKKHVFFIEFKKPGERPRRKQLQYHKTLSALGFNVYVHDTVSGAIESLKLELEAYVN